MWRGHAPAGALSSWRVEAAATASAARQIASHAANLAGCMLLSSSPSLLEVIRIQGAPKQVGRPAPLQLAGL